MALTNDLRTQVRRLHDRGVRWQVIADLLGVSRAMIQNLTDEPPSAAEIAAAEVLLDEVRVEIEASEERFGCYRGDSAVLMREIFGDSPLGPSQTGGTPPDEWVCVPDE